MQEILWFEILFKAAVGIVLLVLPLTAASVAGLERPATSFWPRLLGCTVLGVAVAVVLTVQFPNARGGLGPAGLVAINFGAASGLLVPLILGNAAQTRRGRLLVLVVLLLLAALGFLEIAHI